MLTCRHVVGSRDGECARNIGPKERELTPIVR